MKLKYNAQNRTRINYRFMGFTTFENGWWFNHNTNSWQQNPKAGEKGYSSHQNCRSVKAFRRKLKKAPKGVKFILVSRWVGYDVEGIGSFACVQRLRL
jgi:hypothetical protein